MNYLNRASDILRKKKQNFAGFSGANSRKNRPISRDFRRKKSIFAEKSADFAEFSWEKSQISQKNQPISRDFSGKSQISKDFRGKFLEKSADFTGNFGGKLRQETISKKQPISLDVFGKFR